MGTNQHQKNSFYKRLYSKAYSYLLKAKAFLLKFKAAILISLVGGIPGIINIYNWAYQSPGFVFHTETITDGGFYTSDSSKTNRVRMMYYLVSGAIYNSGKEPLFPYIFELEAVFEDTVIVCKSLAIDSSKTDIKKIYNSDLMRVIRVNPSDAAFGTIFFPINVTQKNIKPSNMKSLKITCMDILLKKRSYKIDLGIFVTPNGNFYYPKTGIKNY